jgi:hypothetical protein
VAPTNVPGEGGLPGCATIVSASGTSAHCNCGGTPAPTLSPTASGFINCGYTIQPTSSYNPAISTAVSFAPGGCKVQVWQGGSVTGYGPDTTITVNITDATGMVIGHNSSGLNWGQTLGTDSQLPMVMLVTPRTSFDEMIVVDPVSFAYGSQTWYSNSSQCSIEDGGTKNLIDLHIDCEFNCTRT